MHSEAMHSEIQNLQDDEYVFPYHYVPQFSPAYSQFYSWPWSLYYVSAMEFVLEKVRSLEPTSVVDVGTGDGRMVRELACLLPETRVAGIDYSERAVQLARALNPDLDFLRKDIILAPPLETFDVVTLIEVFEHIPPELTTNFAAAVRRLIRENGHLIVTVPHRNVPVSRKHYQHFSAYDLRRYFEPNFVLEETVFLDKRSRMVGWIENILENRYFILAHSGIRNRLYKAYKHYFLITDEAQCGRVFMRFRAKAENQP
jgi:SAM-dependent methyltransferase